MYFDARVVSIDVFVEVGFDDAVVIDAESFTEGIRAILSPPSMSRRRAEVK